MSTASEVSRQPTQLQGAGYTEAFDRAMSTSSSFDTGVSGSRRNNGRGNGRELSTGDSASGSYSQTQSHDASLSQGLRHGGESSTTSSRNGNTSPEDAFWDAQQPSSGRNSNLGAYDFGNDGSGMLRPGQPAVFSHSNASAPHFDEPGSASRGPPLADDLGLDKLSIDPSAKRRGQVLTGSSNSSTQAIPQSRERIASSSYDAELQRSADEVRPANGLRAIADELDRTADDFVGPGTRRGSERSSGGTSSATHGRSTSRSQTLPNPDVYAQGGYGPQPGSSAYPQYVPQNAFLPGASYRERRPSEQYAQQQGVYEPGQYPGQGGGWYGPDGTYYDEAQMQAQQQQYGVDPFAQAPPHHQQANGYFTSPQMAGAGYEGAAGPSMGGPMWAPGYSMQYPGGPAPPPGYGMYAPPPGMDPSGQLSAPYALHRQSTGLSSVSAVSANSAAARRRSKDAAAKQTQQSLPFNKAFVDEYRQRMKGDPDAEAQFAYARYLIEAAKKVSDPKDGPKQARKYRDSLLGESLKLIKRLATTGMGLGKPPFAEAQFFLANCFGNGSLGLQVDHEKAYNLYVQASKQNHAAATYRTAVCNEVGAGTRRDHHRAVLFYRKASALGDTAGMYKLGMILLNGLLGQPRNIREAIVWLKRAAGQADEDNPHALHELGLLHEKPNNNVVPVDEAYARELFTQAAQLGYAPSQFKLGSAYEYGSLTCPVDPRRSIAWYTKAAGKNDGESELALSGWYLTGSEGVLKQSDSEAYLWARRAATKGIPKAEYAVGYYSEVGIGVDADVEEAKRWYMRAAAQGNKRAMMRLTELKQQRSTGRQGKKARPTRKDAERECIVM